MYFTVMNILCFGVLGYLLHKNNMAYQDFSLWAIFVIVIIIQLLPVVCFGMTDDDTK